MNWLNNLDERPRGTIIISTWLTKGRLSQVSQRNGTDEFVFLTLRGMAPELSRDYLVIAHPHGPKDPVKFEQYVENTYEGRLRKQALCGMDSRARSKASILLPFDAAASSAVAGEWLRVHGRNLIWPRLVTRKRVESDAGRYEVIEWQAMRGALEAELSR